MILKTSEKSSAPRSFYRRQRLVKNHGHSTLKYAERKVRLCLLYKIPRCIPSFHGFSSDILLFSSPSALKVSCASAARHFPLCTARALTALSLVASVLLLIFGNKGFWQSLVDSDVVPDYTMLTVTAGVILVSGMMHTEHTIAPVQFASYGMLIVAMILRTVQTSSGAEHPFMFWYSLAFLTVFSMAIPVMYRSEISRAALFHVTEALAALALVACFTWMLRDLFTGQGSDLLRWIPMIIAAVADAVILAMRWREKVNTFVLIFIILSAVVFVVGRVVFATLTA